MGSKAINVILIAIALITLLMFTLSFIFLPIFVPVFFGPGVVYAQFKNFLQDQQDFYKNPWFNLKHFLFSWLINLLGLNSVDEKAVPHESPFIGGSIEEAVPFMSVDVFFGKVTKIEKYDKYNRDFYYYPTYGMQNRDNATPDKDAGYYTNFGGVYLVYATKDVSLQALYTGRNVSVTITKNLVDLQTTINAKCVSVINDIPTPLNKLSLDAISIFPNPPDGKPYSLSKFIETQYPPAPLGDPIVGTEGWITEHINDPNMQSALQALASKKEALNEFPYLTTRVAFVGGKVGAQINSGEWGEDKERKDVQQRFVETFRFFPKEVKHLTIGKTYDIFTQFATARDAALSTTTLVFEKKDDEKDMSKAIEDAKAFYGALIKQLANLKQQSNFPFKKYIDGSAVLNGNSIVIYTQFTTKIALYMLGIDPDSGLLDDTNFKETYFEYPIYFEIANATRGVLVRKNSGEEDESDQNSYIAFYKAFSRRDEYDEKTESEDTFVNPLDFMVSLSEIRSNDQNLKGFEGSP